MTVVADAVAGGLACGLSFVGAAALAAVDDGATADAIGDGVLPARVRPLTESSWATTIPMTVAITRGQPRPHQCLALYVLATKSTPPGTD